MPERYICIHSHCYQPPRSNPWLDAIEDQPSAHPYANWNARITAECYAPNTAARILDADKRLVRLVNTYAHSSFNVGPTLCAWLAQQAPAVYAAILAADQESQQHFAGHGSALAQAYNHLIMPLANRRDKQTQIRWGIDDFTRRFRRPPEGMWLPETAVDVETLDLLAAHGIRFTILAPTQAARVRPLGSGPWREVGEGQIDPSMAYVQHLPSGRQIGLFFYHSRLSRGVAFERLLDNGLHFAQQLLGALQSDAPHAQLVHVATDGETYGHHHRFGEMALAYALDYLDAHPQVRLTNYGAYLERHPPTHEVEIRDNTSWSCAHGVERWRRHCGCHTGGPSTWQQAWRTPLRTALDGLRDALAPLYETHGALLLHDPWAARDTCSAVLLERTPATMAAFLHQQAKRPLTPVETVRAWQLLEMQHQAMLMYTSCGWFFDDLAGVETQQVLLHAARAMHLAQQCLGETTLEEPFLAHLAQASSNRPEEGDGRQLYLRRIRPAMVGWEPLAVQYAMQVLCSPAPPPTQFYCYRVALEALQRLTLGATQAVVGCARWTSDLTQESVLLGFAAVHRDGQHLYGGAHIIDHAEADQALLHTLRTASPLVERTALLRALHEHFGASTWSLRGLRPSAQRQIATLLLDTAQRAAEDTYQQLYATQLPLLHTLRRLRLPLPPALRTTVALLWQRELRRAWEAEPLDLRLLRRLLDYGRQHQLPPETVTLPALVSQALGRLLTRLAATPTDLAQLHTVRDALALLPTLAFGVDLWPAQQACYPLCHTVYPQRRQQARPDDPQAQAWLQAFAEVAAGLAMALPPATPTPSG